MLGEKSLKWTDIHDIALALSEKYPEIQPLSLRFTELYAWIISLEGFEDDKNRCNEKILEAIQMAWMAEVE